MPLPVNSRLGPYDIRSLLGTGGMGEVYRAHDSRLRRDVALKVLREDGAASAEYRSRFEAEARAVAALNHPNIVGVYDFGIETGQQFIVSELIEGESLRSLLTGKPLPVRRLVEIATQVADGLAAAHAAGIIHRDIKPENIMLAKDGRIKILDFGLSRQGSPMRAQATGNTSDETKLLQSDAICHQTVEGTLMGTAGYMSPEQAVGKEVDYRSDQFSFGLVLHEMASGKQTFARTSTVETMAAIIRDEPTPIEQKLPPPLQWIIDRCLQKEREQRYESTRDLFHDLKNLRDHFSEAYTSGVLAPVAAPATTQRKWKLPVIAAACLLFGSLAAYFLKPAGQDIGKYRYTPIASDAQNPMWSPDGKSLAYEGKVNGIDQVFLRTLSAPAAIQLTHEAGNVFLIGWASDRGHLIVATYDPKLFDEEHTLVFSSVATFGGELQKVMNAPCDGCSMSADGKAFATLRRVRNGPYGVWVSEPFGTPLRQYLPAPFASEALFGGPTLIFSPDGSKLLLCRSGNVDHPEVWLLPYPMGSGAPKQILKGHALFSAEGLSWFPDNRHVAMALASSPGADEHLWIADTQSGTLQTLSNGTHEESDPNLSPDGLSLLYSEITRTFDLASVSILDGSTSVLSTGGHLEHKPAWAARQNRLVWVSDRSGLPEIWLRSADGSERPVVTVKDFPPGTTTFFMNPALAPEDDRLIYGRSDENGRIQLWISLLNGAPPVRVTNSNLPGAEYAGNWSPDGKQYVFLQKVGDRADLTTVRTNGNATPVLVKQDVNQFILPAWSPRGDWILYADDVALGLVSPDGTHTRSLGDLQTSALAFSKDGSKLYGIRENPGLPALFEVDANTQKVKVIKELGDEWRPRDNLLPAIRFTLSPDGTSLLYSVSKYEHDIWMLQGYRRPGWLDRLPLTNH